MNALALAHAVRAATGRTCKIFTRIRSALLWFAATIAEVRIHKARLEAETFGNRYRLKTKTDDDLPVIL